MKARLLAIVLSVAFLAMAPAALRADSLLTVASPNHEQTFAAGTETHRAWGQNGRHLVLYLSFTNDPFVDRENPRQYDNFTFDFPQITLGANGHVFYCRQGGRLLPVAVKASDLLGVGEIRLLPHAELLIQSPHGYLSLALQVHEGGGVALQ